MDYEEKLINQYNQLNHREEVKSGYHSLICWTFVYILLKYILFSVLGEQ